ncbi:MAG: hypothetical protein HHJ17_18305 [Rhodoferax sp.]|uniref:hypothetical protein n=1 Tax=Rhodoferax sp. TaxID=50421 RepID=UPI0017E3977B|nr:hypothetical protein [Rhodoferax sp.]NMM15475.1 hypothetical protein [Rhodoferax sp.]
MQTIRDPADAATVTNLELRTCIEKTISDLSEDYPYDPDVLGYFLVVEPGDSIDALNAQLGFDILANKWTGIRFDQLGYTQSFEVLDEHAGFFEMVFIISDDGFGIEVFIPKTGVDPELLAMCRKYAMPVAI